MYNRFMYYIYKFIGMNIFNMYKIFPNLHRNNDLSMTVHHHKVRSPRRLKQDSVHAVKRLGGWKAQGPSEFICGSGGQIWFQGGFHGHFIGIAYSWLYLTMIGDYMAIHSWYNWWLNGLEWIFHGEFMLFYGNVWDFTEIVWNPMAECGHSNAINEPILEMVYQISHFQNKQKKYVN